MSTSRLSFRSLQKCLKPRSPLQLSTSKFQRRSRTFALTLTSARSITNTSRNAFPALHSGPTSACHRVEISSQELVEPLKIGARVVGQSGKAYGIDQILQLRTDPILSCVYLATYVCFRLLLHASLNCSHYLVLKMERNTSLRMSSTRSLSTSLIFKPLLRVALIFGLLWTLFPNTSYLFINTLPTIF